MTCHGDTNRWKLLSWLTVKPVVISSPNGSISFFCHVRQSTCGRFWSWCCPAFLLSLTCIKDNYNKQTWWFLQIMPDYIKWHVAHQLICVVPHLHGAAVSSSVHFLAEDSVHSQSPENKYIVKLIVVIHFGLNNKIIKVKKITFARILVV